MKFSGLAFSVALTAALIAPAAHAVVSFNNPDSWVLPSGALEGTARVEFSNASGNFVCSGSLLQGGSYVLTAAHCVDDFTSLSVNFRQGSVARTGAEVFINSNWNGQFATGADIALIRLDQAVNDIQGFALADGNVMGNVFLMAGHGLIGSGNTGGTGFDGFNRPHYGYNVYDVGFAGAYGFTYVYDFDNGTANQNTHCQIYLVCGAGLGINEALIAGGDSGGGSFVWDGTQWLLAGVHSFGRTFGRFECPLNPGQICGDIDNITLNSSFGETAGDTAVFSHMNWINAFINPVNTVPEPSTLALVLLGLTAVAWRRRD
ncbi:MAG: trypsin-like serine protease [Rhizobacter sp.]